MLKMLLNQTITCVVKLFIIRLVTRETKRYYLYDVILTG